MCSSVEDKTTRFYKATSQKKRGWNRCLRCYDSCGNKHHQTGEWKKNQSLSVLAMCDTGSPISFAEKWIVSTLHLQSWKTSFNEVGNHGSQDVKTEIMPITVSIHEKSRPLTTVQFYIHEKLKLGDQIVDMQVLEDHYTHLRNLPNQSYNLNEIQIILAQDCYDIHHPLEFKKSTDKTAPCAVKLIVTWALSGPLPAKPAAALATTATQVSENTLAN